MRKNSIFIVFVAILLFSACDNIGNILKDQRDGQEYKIIKIGRQVWMAENLNYKTDKSWCYDDELWKCEVYGRLYDWETAVNVCPEGWHLPTRAEWSVLIDYLGQDIVAGVKMKKHGLPWISNSSSFTVTNKSGFSGIPGGRRDYRRTIQIRINGSYVNFGNDGYWWSSSPYRHDDAQSHSVILNYDSDRVYRLPLDKRNGLSVRCLRD